MSDTIDLGDIDGDEPERPIIGVFSANQAKDALTDALRFSVAKAIDSVAGNNNIPANGRPNTISVELRLGLEISGSVVKFFSAGTDADVTVRVEWSN